MEPLDHALGRSRGGWGTKIHLLCDSQGIPLIAKVTAGQAHESPLACPLMESCVAIWPEHVPDWVAGDKGYSAKDTRSWLKEHGIHDAIAWKDWQHRGRPKRFPRRIYRLRNVIERLIGWLKEFRALATRFEKLAVNFLGTIHLAFIHRYLALLTRRSPVNTA